MESFSKNVKNQLQQIEIKKKCCRYTASAIEELCRSKTESISGELSEIYNKCRCDGCKTVFVRMLFCHFGSVTSPDKQYHLDFSFKFEDECDTVSEILSDLGFEFKSTVRRERFVLYIKESSAIEDFLVFIGAQSAAFEVMNSKIVREFRNSVNRQVNCDTANIEKQLASAKKYTDAINKLIDTGKIDSLPEELKITAQLRAENEQLSLSDLGKLFNPPVSKSGIRHRLDKILTLAENID